MSVKITAIVAMADNNCIGQNNDLPWHIPADLKRFKELTTGKPVIMGRKTFDSIFARLGKPLPNRTNIIITRQNIQIPGVIVCHDIESAVEQGRAEAEHDDANTDNEIIIGGGAEIYRQALPFTDRIYLTRVHKDVDGDAWFPQIPPEEWQEDEKQDFEAVEGQHPAYSYSSLTRI